MQRLALVVVAALSLGALGARLPARSLDFDLKDALAVPPRGWVKTGLDVKDRVINLRIGVKQDGIDTLRAHLLETSDPSHPRYGQHLSHEEVHAHSQPSSDSLEAVYGWLEDHGIDRESCSHSLSKDWVVVPVPVSKAEEMLDAEYSLYRHAETGNEIVRTESYSLPKFVKDHVDVIAPTNWFSRMHANKKTSRIKSFNVGSAGDFQVVDTGPISKICNTSSVSSVCLRTFYGSIDYVPKATNVNSVGVTGYLGESALKADLQMFLKAERPDAVGRTFATVQINGGTDSQTLNSTQITDGTDIEANLDVQTVFGVTSPTPATFFSTGGSPPFIPDDFTPTDTNEPYLQFLEFILAQKSIPKVITTSYDDDEQTVPKDLAIRVCNDFMRLGNLGVSVLFASGDDGVGPTGTCFTNDGKNTSTFLPEFPSTCPFVTSVGATMNFNPEVAVKDLSFSEPFFSGGGFSNYFARPSYQDAAVVPYLTSIGELNKGLFNPAGRGIPDVAAQGSNFNIAWDGQFLPVSGTSASTPLFSSFVTLLNDFRLSQGQSSLGFLNPFIYSTGHEGLNDITSGSSSGCDTNGFPAAKGWDAVSGFGTPNFQKLLTLVRVPE